MFKSIFTFVNKRQKWQKTHMKKDINRKAHLFMSAMAQALGSVASQCMKGSGVTSGNRWGAMSHNASVTYAFSFIDKLLEAASEVSDAGEFDALGPKIQKLTVKGNLLFKGKGLSYLVGRKVWVDAPCPFLDLQWLVGLSSG